MKRLLFLLIMLFTTNVYAGGQQTLVDGGGRVFGTSENPLQVTVVGGGLPAGNDGNSNNIADGDDVLTLNRYLAILGIGGPNGSGPSYFGSGINIPDGQEIQSNGYRVNYNLSVYASGTVYSLTDTQALVDFGTTDPTITLDNPGTYNISGAVQLKYTGATFAANQTATCKLRRVNNTPSDLSNATRTIDLAIVTTITDNAGLVQIPQTFYITSNTTDQIQIFCALSAATGAGTVDVTSAEITAVRMY